MLQKTILTRYKLSTQQFDKLWQSMKSNIAFEQVPTKEKQLATELLQQLNLDVTDADYIALCLKHAPATFWTFDTLFVKGDSANELRKTYQIYGNYTI